jgi:hypothetical protein
MMPYQHTRFSTVAILLLMEQGNLNTMVAVIQTRENDKNWQLNKMQNKQCN